MLTKRETFNGADAELWAFVATIGPLETDIILMLLRGHKRRINSRGHSTVVT
jgi:hypothetical protein